MSLISKRYAMAVMTCIGLIIMNFQLEIISKFIELSRNTDASENYNSNSNSNVKLHIVWNFVNETLILVRVEEHYQRKMSSPMIQTMNSALNKVKKVINIEKATIDNKNDMREILNTKLSTNINTTIFKKWFKTYTFDVSPIFKNTSNIFKEIKLDIMCYTYMSLHEKWSYSIYIQIEQTLMFEKRAEIISTLKSEIDIDSSKCVDTLNLNDASLLKKCNFFIDIITEVSSRMNIVPNKIEDIIRNEFLKLKTDINQTLINNTNANAINTENIVKYNVNEETMENTESYMHHSISQYLGQAIITSFTESQIQIFISTKSLEQRYINLMNINLNFRKNAFNYGFLIAQIPGGILSYVYPAHNVFGITIPLATIFYLLTSVIGKKLSNGFCVILTLIRFCHGLIMGMATPACNGIWRLWAPQSERPVLSTIALLSTFTKLYHPDLDIILEDIQIRIFLYYLFGFIGLFWYIAWLFLIYGRSLSIIQCNALIGRSNNDAELSSNTMRLSIQQKFFNVPWNKIFTSIPVYAIIIASICDSSNNPVIEIFVYTYILGNVNFKVVVKSFSIFTKLFVILSFVGIILTNCCRKTSSVSTTIIRKLVTCFSFVVEIIMFFIAFYDLRILTDISSIYWLFAFNLFKEIGYLGYGVNQIDIAPRYAGILTGVTNTIGQIFQYFFYYMFGIMYQYKIINDHHLSIVAAMLLIVGTIIYGRFASGVQQSWAEPQNGQQQTVVKATHLREIISITKY